MSTASKQLREALKHYARYVKAAHHGPLSDPCDELYLAHITRMWKLEERYGRQRVRKLYARRVDQTIVFCTPALTFHAAICHGK